MEWTWCLPGKGEKGLTKTRGGQRNHGKTVWPEEAEANSGRHDNKDTPRLQTVGQEEQWNAFEQKVLKETQSCGNELSDCREEDLEAREDSEGVQLVSAELLCSQNERSSKRFSGTTCTISLHF